MKIVIEMSLAKYVNSGLCGRNATEWGKCFSYDELDQLEGILKELQESETIDETTIDNYFMYYDSIESDLEYEIKQSLSHDGYDNVTDQVKYLVSDIVDNYKASQYPQTNDGLSNYLQNVKLGDLF